MMTEEEYWRSKRYSYAIFGYLTLLLLAGGIMLGAAYFISPWESFQ